MVLHIIVLILALIPFMPATENPHWVFRFPDFGRLQMLCAQAVAFLLFFIFEEGWSWFGWLVLAALTGSMVYQLIKVFPYSPLFPRKKYSGPSDAVVSILAGNVFQDNDQYDKFTALVKENDPDLVLTMETNAAWEKGISEIEKNYPFTVKAPLENYYGMHLYSKVPLKKTAVNFQVEEDVPSIYFYYPLNGTDVFFACLHPAPPSPTENDTSEENDAEMMLTGKHIRKLDQPVVVCGDMNDVVWSRTTRLFKKMTGMVDPRIGRGFFSTYNAHYWFLRFPLDHLFHTQDLFVGTMKRLGPFGSDHFAMYYEIHHKKNAKPVTNPPLKSDEKEDVEERVEKVEK